MRHPLLPLLLLLAACYGSGEPSDITPPPSQSDEVRILGGPAECDGCSQLDFTIGGPDLQWVSGARFVRSADERDSLAARIELRRFTGDSGIVLQARAYLTAPNPGGEYDLVLFTPGRPDGSATVKLAGALRITRSSTPPLSPPLPPSSGRPGTLRLLVTAVGDDRPSSFFVATGECWFFYYESCTGTLVPSNTPTDVPAPAGSYQVQLSNVPTNCTVTSPSPLTVTVKSDSATAVTFAVSCRALGTIRVLARTTGVDLPSGFAVTCDLATCDGALPVNDAIVFRAPSGPNRITLQTPPRNCRATGPTSVVIEVPPQGNADVAFDIVCEALPEVRVTVNANVANLGFQLVDQGSCYYGGYCETWTGQAGTPLVIRTLSSFLDLRLAGLTADCRLTSPNPVGVMPVVGAITDVRFDVTCT